MACLLFGMLWSRRIIETPYDAYWFALLLALEGPQYLRCYLWWRHRV